MVEASPVDGPAVDEHGPGRYAALHLEVVADRADRAVVPVDVGIPEEVQLGRGIGAHAQHVLEQQELLAESQWIGALNNYKQNLDNFKIQLGLTTDANIMLDNRDLEQLKILHPDISIEDAIKVALAANRMRKRCSKKIV